MKVYQPSEEFLKKKADLGDDAEHKVGGVLDKDLMKTKKHLTVKISGDTRNVEISPKKSVKKPENREKVAKKMCPKVHPAL